MPNPNRSQDRKAYLILLALTILALASAYLIIPTFSAASAGDTNLTSLILTGDLAVGDNLTIAGDLNIGGSNLLIDTYAITYTTPITITGVLTNVRLLYYQVP